MSITILTVPKVIDLNEQVQSKTDADDAIMVAVNNKVEEWKVGNSNWSTMLSLDQLKFRLLLFFIFFIMKATLYAIDLPYVISVLCSHLKYMNWDSFKFLEKSIRNQEKSSK